jgi:epoxyqueuosine reductase
LLMSEKTKNYEVLKKFALDKGFSVFGVADIIEERERFCLDRKTSLQFDSALSMGKRLLDQVIEDIEDRPTPLYFHHYRQLNFFLDRAAFHVATYIQERDFKALPIPASQTIDWKNQKGHLSHKKIGVLAGLGWIGRNNLLVNPKWGSQFRLVTVLTDMPLQADMPLERDCGDCRRCLPVCPAHAIKRRQDFDHWACYEMLKEFHKLPLIGQHICGICVKACYGFDRK